MLAAQEREYVKNVVLQLECQKHRLFNDYETRLDDEKVRLNEKLDSVIKKMENELQKQVDVIEAKFAASKEKRMSILSDLEKRSDHLGAMLDHAVQNQIRTKQAWDLGVRLVDVQNAINSSQPFVKEWNALLDASRGDSVLETAISAVPPKIVANGVSTKAELCARFDDVEKAGREAVLIANSGIADGSKRPSFWAYPLARITSWFMVSQRTDEKGESAMDSISRAGYHVTKGDLNNAAKELEVGLSGSDMGVAREVVSDWVNETKNRALLEQTLVVLRTRMAHRDVVSLLKNE